MEVKNNHVLEGYNQYGGNFIIRVQDITCKTSKDIIQSRVFKVMLARTLETLRDRTSELGKFARYYEENTSALIELILELLENPISRIELPKDLGIPEGEIPSVVGEFVEVVYQNWRKLTRFFIIQSEDSKTGEELSLEYVQQVETLTDLIRNTYRTLLLNSTMKAWNIYRQLPALCNFAAVVKKGTHLLPSYCSTILNQINTIKQVIIYPPLIIEQRINKRSGMFRKVDRNPFEFISLDPESWICYPAKVGTLIILIFFHEKFSELGFSLANLFEMATSEDMENRRVDAIYLFGLPDQKIYEIYGDNNGIFFDDQENDLLLAVVPNEDRFGYFGYLKKMTLTLHNVKMLKKGRMPFHGAFIKLRFKNGTSKNLLIIGDTGAGKSETIEAFRVLAKEYLEDIVIISDDMGSVEITQDGEILGYGTEIGAFVRTDDLYPDYPYQNMDRAIIMNPAAVNARLVIPVTRFETIIKGERIDMFLYANNYEEIDEDHPIIEKFHSVEFALEVFREGAAMSKGTTTATGLTHSYFANPFGAPQYKELHEEVARKVFQKMFENGIFVGQIRTRLGIKGFEFEGPKQAAIELMKLIA